MSSILHDEYSCGISETEGYYIEGNKGGSSAINENDNRKKVHMKTTKILLAAAAVTFTLASFADEGQLYLSPRAAEQRSHMISGSNNDPNLAANRDLSVSPRTLDLRTKAVNRKNDDPNLVAEIRKAPGAPKSLDFPNAASFEVAPVK
jgi:hypothetical protein